MPEEPIAVQEVYQFMNDRDILMSFLGDFNHKVVTSLLSSVKKLIDSREIDFLIKKRFYAIVVECLDNIARHNLALEKEQLPDKYSSTIFAISGHANHFKIQTGNYVFNQHIPALRERLDKVNSLDKEGLKSLYREKISQAPPEGGGLGIIDISLRSGCTIKYEFKPITEAVSFFTLQTVLKK